MDILTMLAMIRAGRYAGGSATPPFAGTVDDYTGQPYGSQPAPAVAPPPEKKAGPFDLVTDEERRRARYAGLSQAGIGLLSTAGTGDYTGGLARAFQGFNEGNRTGLQAAQDRARQADQDERQRRQDSLQEELARNQDTRAQGSYAHQQGGWEDESAKKARQGQAVTSMVRVIEDEAGSDSPEARRARALADLGEDADLARLAALHQDIVARKRLPEDARQKSQLEIEDDRARIAAGVAADPAAAERRADEGLKLERWRTSLYGTQVNKQLDRDPAPVTPQQLNDDVAAEAQRRYTEKLDALKAGQNPGGFVWKDDPAKPGHKLLRPSIPFNAQDLARIRKEAEEEALAAVRARYGASAAPSTGRGVAAGVYRFDAQGNLIPQ